MLGRVQTSNGKKMKWVDLILIGLIIFSTNCQTEEVEENGGIDISGNHGRSDFWIVKLGGSGNIQWQKSLGGSGHDYAQSIQLTTDGGYIVAGYTASNDGDVSGYYGQGDFWIVKLDGSGNIQWQKTLGGSERDRAESIQQTTDGGYIVAGSSRSNDGDVSGIHGNQDFWIVKLDAIGSIQWQRTLGGSASDFALSIQQTADGDYIVAGHTWSYDGDVSGNHGEDFWIVKLDAFGSIQWLKTLGGIESEQPKSIQLTTDGGYILAGGTHSNDGDVSGNHGEGLPLTPDYWIVKLDGSGNIQWKKTLGGSRAEYAKSIQPTTDGGYIVAGYSQSNDGDVLGNHGEGDFWIVKLDVSGNIQWQKSLGGSDRDGAESIQQTTDGGYIVAGYTESNDGDVLGNHYHGQEDYWIVKLDGSGTIQWQKSFGGSENEGAESIQQTADGGYIVAGSARSNNGDILGN